MWHKVDLSVILNLNKLKRCPSKGSGPPPLVCFSKWNSPLILSLFSSVPAHERLQIVEEISDLFSPLHTFRNRPIFIFKLQNFLSENDHVQKCFMIINQINEVFMTVPVEGRWWWWWGQWCLLYGVAVEDYFGNKLYLFIFAWKQANLFIYHDTQDYDEKFS